MNLFSSAMGLLGMYVSGWSASILQLKQATDMQRGFSRAAQYTMGYVIGQQVGQIALTVFRSITPFTFAHPISQICLFSATLILLPLVPYVENLVADMGFVAKRERS